MKLGNRGSFSLIWMLAVVLLGVSGLGLLGLLRHWRFLVEDQLRLNRRVGACVLLLQKNIQQVEHLNEEIRSLRMAIVAGSLRPELAVLSKMALKAAVLSQEALRMQWERLRLSWIFGSVGDRVSSFPSFPWVRDAPDGVGEQVFRSTEIRTFRLGVCHAPRVAAAELYLEKKQWNVRWMATGWMYESARTNFF
jgi:hypothetical protein